MLRPMKNAIIFKFTDEVERGAFKEETNWGFVIQASNNQDASIKEARWATPVSIGPDVDPTIELNKVMILIEPLAWTEGFMWEGTKLWKTDDSRVIGVADIQ